MTLWHEIFMIKIISCLFSIQMVRGTLCLRFRYKLTCSSFAIWVRFICKILRVSVPFLIIFKWLQTMYIQHFSSLNSCQHKYIRQLLHQHSIITIITLCCISFLLFVVSKQHSRFIYFSMAMKVLSYSRKRKARSREHIKHVEEKAIEKFQ